MLFYTVIAVLAIYAPFMLTLFGALRMSATSELSTPRLVPVEVEETTRSRRHA